MLILITGARAPVAIEWARLLMSQGHQVYMTDCAQFPLGRFLVGIKAYAKTVSPRENPEQYQRQISELIDKYQIQMLIPTCEEIFYLAQFKHLLAHTNCLISDANLLLKLHNKFAVFEMLSGLSGVQLPKTKKLTSTEQIDLEWDSILKPVFSRFGEQVIRDVTTSAIQDLNISESRPWVQQQKLTGQALCNYALFDNGKLIAHQVYRPAYCVNGSAATYFQPVINHAINTFIKSFAQKVYFHGQLSFDFIEQNGEYFVIECNPRATSGLHLIAHELRFLAIEHLNIEKAVIPKVTINNNPSQAQYIGFTMLIAGGVSTLFSTQTWRDFFQAKNALSDKTYPLQPWAQIISGTELIITALLNKQSLAAASTAGIEWNGEV
ncbi:ATP-grasp domain-containing protein [uncultured Psychromonas sp.]|uniref:ATP-grasp domain-containing protein n=1 Tax=uncultured Psychromonas sp. TaxID=173974 RepID=UPI002617ADC5|nr:ATP-grasp domain-containing protein [uncultured Psychromonas sp.]